MHIATEDGDVEIREEDLLVITDAELTRIMHHGGDFVTAVARSQRFT
jgi:hypothetical protein